MNTCIYMTLSFWICVSGCVISVIIIKDNCTLNETKGLTLYGPFTFSLMSLLCFSRPSPELTAQK